MSPSSKRRINMASKLRISSSQMGSFLLMTMVMILSCACATKIEESIVPTTTLSSVMMNDMLFKNLSESFSTQELEDAMVSLNRTKRQSLNLQQLALLAGIGGGNNNVAAATAAAAVGQNTSNGGMKQSAESLLASCQLTNLLLYQLMQQRQQVATNPFLSLANANLQGLGSNLNLNIANAAGGAGSVINPFPVPAINQNLIFPAETLKTYTTTTTFVTKMTTTAVVTIPLLFGNKPVPTTITRTKTYDVTTTEVQTVTSTVKPTYVTQAIAPTPTLQTTATNSPSLNDVDEEAQSLVSASVSPKKYQDSRVSSPEYEDEEPVSSPRVNSGTLHSKFSKNSGRSGNNSAKRRKPGRSGQSQAKPLPLTSNTRSSGRDRDYQDPVSRYGAPAKDRDDYYETDYQPYAATSSTKKGNTNTGSNFSKRKYGNIYDDAASVDDDPAAAQYPDDYSYYTRRLKRGEQYGDEGEYQLEPSTDGDFSSNYQKYEKCPPIPKAAEAQTVTVTRTETKTVTKFLGQSTLASNINLNTASRASYEDPTPAPRRRNRTRNRSSTSDQSAASSAPSPTVESRTSSRGGTSEDARAQILLRSRSRYNSNTNNNNYQQPNYDYYRG